MKYLNKDLITRWQISLSENQDVILKRKLVPSDNPINYLLEEDGDYQYTTLHLFDRTFSVVYKEEEKDMHKSVIYVGKLEMMDDTQIILDLTKEDEAYIDILANIFLKVDTTTMH